MKNKTLSGMDSLFVAKPYFTDSKILLLIHFFAWRSRGRTRG